MDIEMPLCGVFRTVSVYYKFVILKHYIMSIPAFSLECQLIEILACGHCCVYIPVSGIHRNFIPASEIHRN